MATIQVFDPALCCSTGVCGVEVDQQLVGFSADVDWAKQNGAAIERFNLAQQPMVFAENAVVKAFLERSGTDALPLILIDGEVALAGRYPSRTELARWTGIAESAEKSASGCCSGTSCC
ncbi:MAG: hypothetical protein RL563_1445 [Pseudomonadota bacterium]|jgi:hypothetical protein